MGYRDEVLADSPFVYWRLGEASGTTAEDETANDEDGTYNGSPTLGATGAVDDGDTAVDFDGVDDYVIAGSVAGDWATFAQASARTFEFWMRTTTPDGDTLFGTVNDGSNTFVQMFLNRDASGSVVTDRTALRLRDEADNQYAEAWLDPNYPTTNAPYDGNWHHIVIVQDDHMTWRVYMDGVLLTPDDTQGTIYGTPGAWQYPLTIGARNVRSVIGLHADVEIDEFALYNTALSGTRVQAHFDAASAPANQPPDTPTLSVDTARDTDVDLSGDAYSDPEGDPHAASQWQVDEDAGDFSTPVFDSGTDAVNLTSVTATGLTPETDYKARVRYQDDQGNWSNYSTAVSFTTTVSSPDTPVLTVDAVRETEADLSGSAYNDPDGDPHASSQWQVDVAAGDFSTPVFDSGEDAVNLLSITATGLTENIDYQGRVRYRDDKGNWSAWSAAVAFSTLVAPDTPVLTVGDVTPTTADLSGSAFSDPDGGSHAASQWQVDEEAGDFSTPVFDSGTDPVNLTSITATGLEASTGYKARVRYQDSDGLWSDWSAAVSFTTITWSVCGPASETSWSVCSSPAAPWVTCADPAATTWESC